MAKPAPAETVVEVRGKVVGRAYPSWTESAAGFKKLEPNEHPRLVFRKSDLPMIRKRLETPEGWAIMARFLEQLPKSHGDWPKVQMYLLGEWMWLPPAAAVAPAEGLPNGQYSGLFILGLTTVPESMKAGARWLFDRSYGMQGDRTFRLLWAYHAAYLLMNYPFDAPAQPPTESLPWVGPDPMGGHWLFRKPWQGGRDSLVVLNTGSDFPGGTHWLIGRNWDMQLFALGRLWIGDRVMNEKSADPPGAALPTTANAAAYTPKLGARLLGWNSTPDGLASLAWDNSPIYMSQLARGAAPGPDQKLLRMSRQGQFIDHGIRATRLLAVDLSGACGAPVLLAIHDQSQAAEDFAWNLRLAEQAGAAKVEGNTVSVGDADGPNMRVTFVGDTPLTLTPAIRATGSDEYFVIITVQNGPPPNAKAAGDTLTVGGQTVRRDGRRLILGKLSCQRRHFTTASWLKGPPWPTNSRPDVAARIRSRLAMAPGKSSAK